MASLILHTGKNGEITIPRDIRNRLGLRKNDSVSIEITGGDICIRKTEPFLRLLVTDKKAN